MAASLVLVGRGARNEDQPTALRATPNPLSLPKRGLRPFLDNPDNLTRMYTLCRDSCVWYDARVAVSKVWLIERASTVRNAFHFASSIRCFFFLFFFFSNWNYFHYIVLKFIEQLNNIDESIQNTDDILYLQFEIVTIFEWFDFIKKGMARKRNETNGLEDGHMKIRKVEIVNCKLHSFYRWGNGTGM